MKSDHAAASIHLSRDPWAHMGEEIGMIDPDYDSMADYVCRVHECYSDALTKVSLSKP